MTKNNFLFVLVLLFSISIQAQPERVFSFAQYREVVEQNHPIAKQAAIQIQSADAGILKARGGFDPYISLDWEQKRFDDKDYFNILSTGFKVPSWYGLEFKGGYDRVSGDYYNPQIKTPKTGLGTLGFSAQLLQGMIIDQRRADLQKAKLLRFASQNDREATLNTLLYEASAAYWEWAKAVAVRDFVAQSLTLAEKRLEGIKNTAKLGDRPMLDTLEALINVQDRRLLLNDAQTDAANAALKLSTYIWGKDDKPLELDANIVPEPWDKQEIKEAELDATGRILESLSTTHPDLIAYGFKTSALEIDKRLKAEKLKPKLEFSYNFLADRFQYWQNDYPAFPLADNGKWSVKFSMPILLRAERGDLEMANLKLKEVEYAQNLKQNELKNKILAVIAKINNYVRDIRLYENTAASYKKLGEAEAMRFEIGESSLFLVNSREVKVLEAQQKLVELYTKYQIERAALKWVTGKR